MNCRYTFSEEEVNKIEYLIRGITHPTAELIYTGSGLFRKASVEQGEFPLGSHPKLFVQGYYADDIEYGCLSELGEGLLDLVSKLRAGGRKVFINVEAIRALGILGFRLKGGIK